MKSGSRGTTFRYVTADGEVHTRTSKRAYTHVLIGRLNLAKARDVERSASRRESHDANWHYMQRCATHPVGEPFDIKRPWYKNTEELQAQGRACLARYPTAASYVEAMVAEALSRIDPADKGPEVVLQWSQSQRAAAASINTAAGWHVDVRVVALPADSQHQ